MNVSLLRDLSSEAVRAHFDPMARTTRIVGRIAPGDCYALSLPQEWRVEAQGPEVRLAAAGFPGMALSVRLRAAHELQHMPQPDLTGRDAAFLQQDYEALLGRPAQSVSLTASASGAARWSATWIDANFPSASRAMTVEALIAPLSKEWVLELSPDSTAREASGSLVQGLLEGLRVQGRSACEN